MALRWCRILIAFVWTVCFREATAQETSSTSSAFQQPGLCRRWGHQSTLLNTTLYLFGGNQIINTTSGPQTSTNTNFLKLDLTQSFALGASQVPWQLLSPASATNPPPVSYGGLYHTPNFDSLVLFDGQVPASENETISSIWKYNISDNTWAETDHREQTDDSFPNRKSRGVPVQSPRDATGYYLGGARAYQNASYEGWFYDDNVQFEKLDLDSGKFIKENSYELPVRQKRIGPRALWLPIGKKGSIWLLGGTEEHKVRLAAPKGAVVPQQFGGGGGIDPASVRLNPLSPMTVVWVYDIAGGEWHFQTLTGAPPPWERKNFCVTSASSPDNKEHFIYTYGGGTDDYTPFFGMNDTTYADMYILSLPSFSWYQVPLANNAPTMRQLHTCHVVNEHQMIVLGGTTFNSSAPPETNCTYDEMHVFDMSSLEWSDSYTPSTSSFQTPQNIVGAIGQQSEPLNGWNEEGLKELFYGKPPGCTSDEMLEGVIQANMAKVRDATVGGTIAGAFAIIFFSLFLFVIRRRRQEREQAALEMMQLQAAFGFYGKGEISSAESLDWHSPVDGGRSEFGSPQRMNSNGSNQSTGPYVIETSRPLTPLEKLKLYLFQLGGKKQHGEQAESVARSPDVKAGGRGPVSRTTSSVGQQQRRFEEYNEWRWRQATTAAVPEIRPPVPPKTPKTPSVRAELV